MVVSDASVLIALAKMNRLQILRGLYSEILIGPTVKAEAVDAGKRIAASGVARLEEALTKKWIQVSELKAKERRLSAKLANNSKLDAGEAEAIALASTRHHLLLVDDKEGRTVAAMMDIAFIGTAGVFLEAYFKKVINFSQLEEDVEALTRTIWLSPNVVLAILKKAREKGL